MHSNNMVLSPWRGSFSRVNGRCRNLGLAVPDDFTSRMLATILGLNFCCQGCLLQCGRIRSSGATGPPFAKGFSAADDPHKVTFGSSNFRLAGIFPPLALTSQLLLPPPHHPPKKKSYVPKPFGPESPSLQTPNPFTPELSSC